MVDYVGQQFGNYRLLRLLGQGGFAEVYLGEHLYLKSHAALKILHTQLSSEEGKQFISEAQLLARLSHPHIVRVLDFGIDSEGIAYLVTEYAPRGTLRKLHPSGSCLSLETIISYINQIASALQYAHNHSIIHRDIKPENILIGPENKVLLSDFGVSILFNQTERLKSHEMSGTLPYMAPEIFRGKPIFASDQYALAIVVYEWLCGKRPFQGGVIQLAYQHTSVAIPRLRDHDSSIPQAVEDVVFKALAKDPEQRYGNVLLFAQALAQASQADSSHHFVKLATAPLGPERSTQASKHIFLSVAPGDEEFATRLTRDLGQRGITVQRENSRQENMSEDEIRRTIRAIDTILLVASPTARLSPTIQTHLRIANLYQRRLIAIAYQQSTDAVRTTMRPEELQENMRVDLIDAQKQSYTDLLDEIIYCLERENTASLEELPMSPGEPRSPYKGLRAFTQSDASDFFGRERLIEELVGRIQQMQVPEKTGPNRLLALLGSSGSGKSSIVMAGLLPRLRQQAIKGSENWIYLNPMVPGSRPIEALALTLAPHFPSGSKLSEVLHDEGGQGLHWLASRMQKEPDQKIVLFIDQFEEVFTLTENEQERRHFIKLLVTAATESNGPVFILLTLRADFYHRCMAHPRLHQLIEKQQKSVLPMEAADLRAVIRRPAALPDVQLAFEGNLVGDLLFEVQEQAGALPLLQFTLEQLFLRRQGHLLTIQAYREIGGVKGALARHADTTYALLPSEEHRHLARGLFLRLIDPGQTEQDTTRRRAALTELTLPDPQQSAMLRETAEAFIAARLLTTNEVAGTTTIEVSHEALIREWQLLGDWLHHTRDDIHLQQTISTDAVEWQRRDQPEDLLYRGSVLAEAETWSRRQTASVIELKFLEASTRKQREEVATENMRQERELQLQRRSTNRLRLLVSVLSIFLAVSVILSTVAIVSGQEAQKQSQEAKKQTELVKQQSIVANSRSLARQAQLASIQNQKDRALLLAVKAYQMNDNDETRDTLFSILQASPRLETVLHHASRPHPEDQLRHLNGLVFGADDRSLIVTNSQHAGQITIWDLASKKQRFLTAPPFAGVQQTIALASSADGQTLATIQVGQSGLSIKLWDLASGKEKNLILLDAGLTQPGRDTRNLAFSPDGKTLAFASCPKGTTGLDCSPGKVSLFDVASGKAVGDPLSLSNEPTSVIFHPDGKQLAVATCARHTPPDSAPTTQICAESQVLLWDLANRTVAGSLTGNAGYILSLAFSPNSKYLASAGEDGLVSLWDAATGKLARAPFVGHSGTVTSLVFSPDSQVLASGSFDKTVRLWDISNGTPLETLTGHAERVSQLAFSRDGQRLVSGSEDNVILVWKMNGNTSLSQNIAYPSANLTGYSPDGKFLVFSLYDNAGPTGEIVLQEFATGKTIPKMTSHYGQVVFSPDNKHLASINNNEGITLWEVSTGKSLSTFSFPETNIPKEDGSIIIATISFSTDGKKLVSMLTDGTIVVWDIASGKQIGQALQHELEEKDQSLSFANKLFFTNQDTLLSIRAGEFALSPDGKLFASSGSVMLWDLNTGTAQSLLTPSANSVMLWDLKTNREVVRLKASVHMEGLAFSPDGRILATSQSDQTALWDTRTGKPLPHTLTQRIVTPTGAGPQASSVAWSPDGKLILSGGLLWDTRTYTPFLSSAQGRFTGTFFPNSRLFLTPWNNSLLDTQPQSWLENACAIASRNFTSLEWRRFFPGESPHQVCPDSPLHYQSTVIENLSSSYSVKDNTNDPAPFSQALQTALKSDDPLLNDMVCWFGATHDLAREALPACNQAVKLAPDNGNYYDSRGLAKALTGDRDGAVKDFERFVQWAKTNNLYTEEISIYRVEQTITTSYVKEREEWIIALKTGDSAKFPFKNKQQVLQMSDEKIHSACFWAGSEEEEFFINLPI